jgi:predicted phosphodiesterase
MDLSYDGTNYHGWQNQPEAISVQSCIENALSLLIKAETPIYGAGRTDSGVHGNIDNSKIRAEYPENLRFKIEDMKIWITHIGGYPNKYNLGIRQEINSNPPDVFICGHSHILKVINDNKLNLLHINPGAIGKNGFHQVRTMIRFEIMKSKIQNLEVIEFKR